MFKEDFNNFLYILNFVCVVCGTKQNHKPEVAQSILQGFSGCDCDFEKRICFECLEQIRK